MDDIRRMRLEEQLREEISSLISRGEVKDPRVGPFVSVTRVEAARDGSHAKVYVSSFAAESRAEDAGSGGAAGGAAGDGGTAMASAQKIDAAVDAAAAGLSSAAGFIQAQIARRVRLRLTPKLHFIADHGIREGFEMTERIKGLLP